MASMVLVVCLFAALACAVGLFPENRDLHTKLGVAMFASAIPFFIAWGMMIRLNYTQQVAPGAYALPYKLKKSKGLPSIFGVSILLLTLMQLHRIDDPAPTGNVAFPLPGWATIPLLVWLPFGSMLVLATWRGVILHPTHLCHYVGWIKHDLEYRDIERVEAAAPNGSRKQVMEIHHTGKAKSPLRVHLALFPEQDIAIMLSMIRKASPHAALDDQADKMSQGEFSFL